MYYNVTCHKSRSQWSIKLFPVHYGISLWSITCEKEAISTFIVLHALIFLAFVFLFSLWIAFFCNISIVTYPLDLTIDNNRHHCYTATQGKHRVKRILYSSVHKRLSLTLPCWKLAFCTASVFCCRLSIQQHWHDSNALYCKKLLHFVFRDSLWVFQISTNYRCT